MAVDRDKVLQAAQKLVERKRYDKAIVEYQKLVAEDPKDVRTLLKIGDLHLKLDNYVEAITTYEQVGQFYSTQGHALKAIAVYKQIRDIIHKHVPQFEDRFGHIVPRLAEIYTQLSLTSDALAAYDEVATRLQRAGRDRDAIDIFRKIVDLDPNNPLPYLRLADALIRVRDYDNAIKRYGVAAEILLKLGRRDDALKVVERLLQHRPEARFARMAAEIYLDRGGANDGMAALKKLQISFKENPKDLETLTLLARSFDLLQQPNKAIDVQKESARIAKEAGRVDQFTAIVTSLLARAPDDEGVRQLAAQLGPASVDPRSSIDVVIEEDVEVIEEAEPPSAAPMLPRQSQASMDAYDPAALARQVIAQAEGHRRSRQLDKAVAVLRSGVQNLPAARNVREKLWDTLMELGDQEGAIQEMLAYAHYVAEQGDVEAAAHILDEVLLIEPGHARTTEMLRALGYEVPQEVYEEAAPEIEPEPYTGEIHTGEIYDTGAQQYAPAAPQYPASAPQYPASAPRYPASAPQYPAGGQPYPPSAPQYDPNAPLPSYDLEEVGAAEALSRQPSAHPGLVDNLDDPFGTEAPLPSFPMDDELTRFQQAVEAIPAGAIAPSAVVRPPSAQPPPVYPTPVAQVPRGAPAAVPPAVPSQRADALDEDALEEVEFFAQHGMFEEARNILEEQLSRLPNHPLLMERLREVTALAAQAHAAADNQSGTRVVPRAGEQMLGMGEDRAFDIAESLEALDGLEIAPDAAGDPQQVSVETVFEQFKAGVAAQISPSDAATHYDLGVAYKEMGLYPDAISEFELASRDPGRECVCQSMIGVIYLQMGNVDGAIDAFIRGLHASHKTMEQELALNYEIANAYEMRGIPEQALYYFQRVARISPSYSDPRGAVADRMRRLEVPKPAPRAAVGAEMLGDDFDAAFDDLLSGSKLP